MDFNSFPVEIINIMIDYLSNDYDALSKLIQLKSKIISKRINDMLKYRKNNIIENIILDLSNYYKIDGREFIQMMKQNNYYISGSYLLNMINTTLFDDDKNVFVANDIDLYHDGKNTSDEFIKYLQRIGFVHMRNIPSKYDKRFMVMQFGHKVDEHTDKYTTDKPIQLIYRINHEGIDNIINSFDFSICSNYTDGTKIFVKDIIGIQNAQITIINKTACFIHRLVKYISRGYTVKNFDKNMLTKYESCYFLRQIPKKNNLKSVGINIDGYDDDD